MKFRIPNLPLKLVGWLVAIAILVPAFVFRGNWFPGTEAWVKDTIEAYRKPGTSIGHGHEEGDESDSGDHAHGGHSGHDEASSLELSEQALRNLGLTTEFIQPVKLATYRRSIRVPAVVVERPGRTRLQVATPMTGVIRHVHAVAGEAVKPGTLLFEIRLTHEDLVLAQTSFLQTLGELDVERREIIRLAEATKTGAVPRVKLLEREYARDKLDALLSAQREALRLHGLSKEQVDQIAIGRRLLRELQVFAPGPDEHSDDELKLAGSTVRSVSFQKPIDNIEEAKPDQPPPLDETVPLVISELRVHKGQSVDAGETLCTLSDYSRLYVEGLAFEQDAGSITAAARRDWKVKAIFQRSDDQPQTLDELSIIRLSNEIDVDSRTLHFYAELPNSIERLSETEDGNYFVGWRYRPGQRLQLEVPIEEWPNEIVLPVEAVTKEGAEFYAFQQNGNHFDRVAVHVKYRDQSTVVIANDGAVFPGDVVAWRCAHQMQMALKNKSGAGADPHAGHTH